jgi:predicted flap endonuclease-1-like 5' DNA nuclease
LSNAESAAEPAPPAAFATKERQDRQLLGSVALRSAPRPSVLGASLTTLHGAGPRLAAAAAELGIETLGEMLLHVPHS